MKHLKHAPALDRPMRPRRRRALDAKFKARREALDKLKAEYLPKPLFSNRSPVNYLEYLHSPVWFNMRASIFEKRGRRCESCGISDKKASIQIHHLHYGTLGNERPKDVIILCNQCHRERHSL